VKQAVEAGIAPETVAEVVFEAVREGRFYILTHQDSYAGVKVRMDDILKDRKPTLLSM
jgi:hypothetical protein